MNKDKIKLFKNTGIYFAGNFAAKFLSFLMLPLYTQYLEPADYGAFDLAASYSILLVPLFFIQISDGIIRFVLKAASEREKDVFITNAFAIAFCSTIISMVLIPILSNVLNVGYSKIFTLYFILNALSTVMQQMVRALGKTKLYAAGGVISTVVMVALNLTFILGFGLKAEALFLASSGTAFTLCLVMFVGGGLYRHISSNLINKNIIKELIKYCTPLIPNSISWHMVTIFSRTMLGQIKGAEAQGLYAVANYFPTIITMITGIFYLAWQEMGIKVYSERNGEKIYSDILNMYIVTLAAGIVALLPIAKLYIQYALADAYSNLWVYLPLMCVTAALSAIASFYGTSYLASKRTVGALMTTIIAAVVNISINAVFIPIYGQWSVVVAGFIAFALLCAIRMYTTRALILISVDIKKCMLSVIIVIAVSIMIYICDSIQTIILLIVIAIVIAFVMVFPLLKEILGMIYMGRANR